MDKNKLEQLKAIGYKIQRVCGFCEHARLSMDGWGTCARKTHSYQHEKHTEEERQLSIHQFGTCPDFSWDQMTWVRLHSWVDLIQTQQEHQEAVCRS